MSKDDLEKRVEILNEKLVMNCCQKKTTRRADTLEKKARKLSNFVVRMHYCTLAIIIITLFLHLSSVFYKDFPLETLYNVMVSATLGSYIVKLMLDIRFERKRFCSLDDLKKMII